MSAAGPRGVCAMSSASCGVWCKSVSSADERWDGMGWGRVDLGVGVMEKCWVAGWMVENPALAVEQHSAFFFSNSLAGLSGGLINISERTSAFRWNGAPPFPFPIPRFLAARNGRVCLKAFTTHILWHRSVVGLAKKERQNCQNALELGEKKKPSTFSSAKLSSAANAKVVRHFSSFGSFRQTSICNKECEQRNVIKKATETKGAAQKNSYLCALICPLIYAHRKRAQCPFGGCPL